ncbi:MAG: hypothetical protein LBE12_10850, partial [Planctomycetaceae bacterium]|nr:hypothetical protein [Planctomycetaceae bacterium]
MNNINFYFVFTVIFVAFSGCSPSVKRNLPVEYVEGIVTMDGIPLDNASVQFVPKTEGQGEAAGGYTDAKGKYTLTSLNGDLNKGALPDNYIVLITKTISVLIPGSVPQEGDAPLEETKEIVPAAYNNRSKPIFEVT